jgi:hypothetical protein
MNYNEEKVLSKYRKKESSAVNDSASDKNLRSSVEKRALKNVRKDIPEGEGRLGDESKAVGKAEDSVSRQRKINAARKERIRKAKVAKAKANK